jgi:hypothetical protein
MPVIVPGGPLTITRTAIGDLSLGWRARLEVLPGSDPLVRNICAAATHLETFRRRNCRCDRRLTRRFVLLPVG